MTVNEAIAQVRAINRGEYTDEQLIQWLSDLDARIHTEVLMTHIPQPREEFTPISDGERELTVPDVYGVVYRHWLVAIIYLIYNDNLHYNNSTVMFNASYQAYTNWYNRTHAPVKPRRYITF